MEKSGALSVRSTGGIPGTAGLDLAIREIAKMRTAVVLVAMLLPMRRKLSSAASSSILVYRTAHMRVHCRENNSKMEVDT